MKALKKLTRWFLGRKPLKSKREPRGGYHEIPKAEKMVERKPSLSLHHGHISRWDYHYNYRGWKKGSGERRTSSRIFWEICCKCSRVVSSGTNSSTKYLSNGVKLGCERNSLVGLKLLGTCAVRSLITLHMVTVKKEIALFFSVVLIKKSNKTVELKPGFHRVQKTTVTGTRVRHVVTFNPNTANPKERLHIQIPKLKENSCLVPGSLHLLYDFKSKNTKSWFRQNLVRNLVDGLQVKVGGEVAYGCTHESLIQLYKGLWLDRRVRDNMVEYGIGSKNLRKLLSGDDSGLEAGDAGKVSDALIRSIHGSKQHIRLDKIIKILGNHRVFAPFNSKLSTTFIIMLPSAESIMSAQTGENIDGYTLENIELEYETIDNQDTGRSLIYEHITHIKALNWSKDSTVENETINFPRKSLKAVVMLFRNKTVTDSEELCSLTLKQ